MLPYTEERMAITCPFQQHSDPKHYAICEEVFRTRQCYGFQLTI